ncbi:hypothetical protein H1Q58_09615 [Planococcus maritimus]|uniref:Uncharacterized protein n=1 Tax=Planococcus maritimus TaxID=192421 RepID=A0A7D7M9K1_PLAMR|nr:HEPN domain-containing protein [Planococcus maritimus]QMT16235.1 hypothetical protein H1Q58_09615 [Planococcus maritimus]
MEKEELRVEYLIIVDTSNSFCANEKAFNNLLKASSEINMQNNSIKYKNLTVEYRVQTKKIENELSSSENKRFFHAHFKCSDVSKIDIFEDLLRVVRGILYKNSDIHQTLWDDISFYYSQKAYPLIHESENLMRKLITKFMLINVGVGWTKDSIPEEVRNSVKDSKKDETTDYLYKTDFIQLANFLFKEYSPMPINNLMQKLKTIEDVTQISLVELKEYVPKSNWERYFSALVDCEAEYLDKRWKRLYDLRNKIAHNSILNRRDYEEIVKIVTEVREELEKAIESLDKIHVSEEDKEVVTENLASGSNDDFLNFLNEYKALERVIQMGAMNLGRESKSLSKNLNTVVENGLIDKVFAKEVKDIQAVRNIIIHQSNISVNYEHLKEWTKRCSVLVDELLKISIEFFENKANEKDNDTEK